MTSEVARVQRPRLGQRRDEGLEGTPVERPPVEQDQGYALPWTLGVVQQHLTGVEGPLQELHVGGHSAASPLRRAPRTSMASRRGRASGTVAGTCPVICDSGTPTRPEEGAVSEAEAA